MALGIENTHRPFAPAIKKETYRECVKIAGDEITLLFWQVAGARNLHRIDNAEALVGKFRSQEFAQHVLKNMRKLDRPDEIIFDPDDKVDLEFTIDDLNLTYAFVYWKRDRQKNKSVQNLESTILVKENRLSFKTQDLDPTCAATLSRQTHFHLVIKHEGIFYKSPRMIWFAEDHERKELEKAKH